MAEERKTTSTSEVKHSEVTEDKEQTADKVQEESTQDSLTFSNGVIEKICVIAIRQIDGVFGTKGSWYNRFRETFGVKDSANGVSVEVGDNNSVRLTISIVIEYGAYAPRIFKEVKEVVCKEVKAMTGLDVSGVNLRIEDVLTKEEYESKNPTESDESPVE